MLPISTVMTDTGLIAFVTILVSLVKAILEQTPLAPTRASYHDAVIMAVNALVTVGAVLLWASYQRVDIAANWQGLLVQAVLQFGGSFGLYKGTTGLGGSVKLSTAALQNADLWKSVPTASSVMPPQEVPAAPSA